MAIKLPERNYFTFSELQARWECEENDLRRLIISGALVPSYVYNQVTSVVVFMPSGSGKEGEWEPSPVENDVVYDSPELQEEFKYKMIGVDGFYYLLHPWQTGPLDCSFIYLSKDRSHDKSSGQPCLMVRTRDLQKLTLNEVMRNGAVMKSEVLLFEESESEKAKPLERRKESAYLNTIAVLLELIQTPSPNRKGAAAVINEMEDKYKGVYGISKSRLEAVFASAIRNLKAN
jgi:hypothetical protein